jgi:hypothetical protein
LRESEGVGEGGLSVAWRVNLDGRSTTFSERNKIKAALKKRGFKKSFREWYAVRCDKAFLSVMRDKYDDEPAVLYIAFGVEPEKPPLEFARRQTREPGEPGDPPVQWVKEMHRRWSFQEILKWAWYAYLVSKAHGLGLYRTNYLAAAVWVCQRKVFRQKYVMPFFYDLIVKQEETSEAFESDFRAMIHEQIEEAKRQKEKQRLREERKALRRKKKKRKVRR